MTEESLAAHPFRHGAWRTYTPSSGLAGLQVEHIAQDQNGLLWFATAFSGVSSFDGDTFQTYSRQNGLCGNQVLYILRDSRERLWFATLDGGVCWHDGHDFHIPKALEGFGPVVDCLLEDRDGRIWIIGPDLLSTYDGETVRDLLPEFRRQCGFSVGTCWSLDQDAMGDVWIATKRLVRYDGEHFHVQGSEQGLPDELNLCTIGRDDDSRLWVGYQDLNRVFRHDGEHFQLALEEAMGRVRRIRPDCEGRVWIGTSGGGAYCYDDGEFHHITVADGLAYPTVNDVFQDREGLLWFGTWGGGVNCCDMHHVRRYYLDTDGDAVQRPMEKESVRLAADGYAVLGGDVSAKSNFWSLCPDRQGGLWMGGTYGLMRWNGDGLERFELEDGLGDFPDLTVDGTGRLWIGHSHIHGPPGLRYFDGGRALHMDTGAPIGKETALTVDAEGRLLVGHVMIDTDPEWQLLRYDGQRWDVLLHLAGTGINRLVVGDDGRIWFVQGSYFGSKQGDNDACLGQLHADGTILWHPLDKAMAGNPTNGLLVDTQGRVWVINGANIRCFDGERFRAFGVDDGLPPGQLLCLYEDRQGHLWMGTENGAVRYDGRFFQVLRDPHITGAVRDICEDRDGRLWFATSRGMVRYQPGRNGPKARLLQVAADRTYEGQQAVEVPAASGQVIFTFSGISSLTHPRDMLYTHRLQGFEEGWQPAARRRQAIYEDLPAGEYHFEVKAIDRDLNESAPASLSLTAVPDPRIQGFAEALSAGSVADEFVGESAELRRVQTQLAEVARAELTVLILGETGTGKGLAARALHALSPRRRGPLIQINCGALPEALVESELFGHERGAFTSAVSRKLGKVELAKGGTLFLDEIGDMSLAAQTKLLRLLEERTFERVGGTQTLTADVRVVAATNRDLEQMVEQGSFRQDLFYRLQGFPVRLPPLRERREDIRLLALYFMERMAGHLHKQVRDVSPEGLAALRAHEWPGNVRELEHTVQRAVIVCPGTLLSAQDLGLERGPAEADPLEDMVPPEEYERRYLLRVLERTGGTIKGPKGAAALLKMPVSTLRDRVKKLGIEISRTGPSKGSS
jgi:DNA-binding NtrC family response regulator/ligand-binding sensor domain-containing protein